MGSTNKGGGNHMTNLPHSTIINKNIVGAVADPRPKTLYILGALKHKSYGVLKLYNRALH